MVTIEFTKDEANALRQLLHVAVQSRGLDAAEAAVVIDKKIQLALKAEPKEVE